MKTRRLILLAALVGGAVVLYFSKTSGPPASSSTPALHEPETANVAAPSPKSDPAQPRAKSRREREPVQTVSAVTNRVEKLNGIRETFRALALAGDPLAAMRAAKELKDDNERETALLALVTEWTKGELRQPSWRAQSIAEVGIDAALGMELARQPELALLWANEMTDGAGRAAILRQVAKATVGGDAASAFSLMEQIPANERARFQDEVFQYWGRNDTSAALQWADQLPAEQKEAALKSIREVAPVGIGAVLKQRDNFTVIDGFLPGSPAESNGQLRPGDRLLAVAEGNSQFVDAQQLNLSDVVQMIRGAPDTTVRLRVVNETAPANAPPRTVTITRGQITYSPKK